jgi:Domain of unknown function (DUF4145)
VVACYTCDYCAYPIAATLRYDYRDGELKSYITAYWPTAIAKTDYPDVPDPIASAANEAHLCLAAGSSHGAVALARAVVEAVAKDKGIKKGNLKAKIAALHSAQHISEAMREAAEEIRFAGNEAAHGDLVREQ